ncbi:hypothetical protein IM538_04875 [Cytobacillus suaedae]|nr:hypothetical protein IM538_04875 [Cytobacillus suaedae]
MSENSQLISSFVVRCNLVDIDETSGKKQWRIKVSHVQGEEEVAVKNMDEAVSFMKQVIGE